MPESRYIRACKFFSLLLFFIDHVSGVDYEDNASQSDRDGLAVDPGTRNQPVGAHFLNIPQLKLMRSTMNIERSRR